MDRASVAKHDDAIRAKIDKYSVAKAIQAEYQTAVTNYNNGDGELAYDRNLTRSECKAIKTSCGWDEYARLVTWYLEHDGTAVSGQIQLRNGWKLPLRDRWHWKITLKPEDAA